MPNTLPRLEHPEDRKNADTARTGGILAFVRGALTAVGILAPKSAFFSDPELPEIRAQIASLEKSVSALQNLGKENDVLTEAANGLANPTFDELIAPTQWIQEHLTKKLEHRLSHGTKAIAEDLAHAIAHASDADFSMLQGQEKNALKLITEFVSAVHAIDRHPNADELEQLVNRMQQWQDAIYREDSPEAKNLSIKIRSRAKNDLEARKKEDAESLLTAPEMPAGVTLGIVFARNLLQSCSSMGQGVAMQLEILEGRLAELRTKEALALKTPVERAEAELEKVLSLQKKAQDELASTKEQKRTAEHAMRLAEGEHARALEAYSRATSAPSANEEKKAPATNGKLDSALDQLGKEIMEDYSKQDEKTAHERMDAASKKKIVSEVCLQNALDALAQVQILANTSEEMVRQKKLALETAKTEDEQSRALEKANTVKTLRKRIILAVAAALIGTGTYFANRADESEEPEAVTEEAPVPPPSAAQKQAPASAVQPVRAANGKPVDSPQPPIEAPQKTAGELSAEILKLLGPYEIPDRELYSRAAAETILASPEFSRKLQAARTDRARSDLIASILLPLPEVNRAVLKREMLLTISVLMQSSELAVRFKPSLYSEIFDAVEKAGWTTLPDETREKILDEVLMQTDPRAKPKTEKQVIDEMIAKIREGKGR